MIAFPDGLPLIELPGNGEAVAFDREWLLRALTRAGERTGYQKWWLAEQILEALVAYLLEQFEARVIPARQLVDAVRSILMAIGYGDVAPHFELGQPGARLSLEQLAQEVGSGYELHFFNRLRRELERHIRRGVTHFDLIGLTPCVKQLRARRNWNRQCTVLQEEIITFVRQRTGIAANGAEVTVRME